MSASKPVSSKPSSKKLRHYRGWIALGVLAAVAVTAFALTRSGSAEENATTYQTETVTTGTISVTVSGAGNVTIDGTTEVYSTLDGEVASISVAKDSEVTTGDVLFTLDPDTAEAATAQALATYRQAQQSVLQAKSSLLEAKSNLAQLEKQSESPSSTVSSSDIEMAETKVELAKASLTSAQADAATALDAYEEAKADEEDLQVTAPCSGIIYAVNMEQGDSVSGTSESSNSSSDSASSSSTEMSSGQSTTSSSSSSAPIVIMPEQPFAVCLTVNEADLPSLALGQRAEITFDALSDVTATGEVYEISDTGTNSSNVVTFDVWVSIDLAPDELREGMSASVTIVTDVAQDVLLVSSSAVHTAEDGTSYVLVMADGATTPTQVTVEIGLANDTQTEITSGLSAGQTVVTATVSSSSSDDTSSDTNSSSSSVLDGLTGGTSTRSSSSGQQMTPPSGGF